MSLSTQNELQQQLEYLFNFYGSYVEVAKIMKRAPKYLKMYYMGVSEPSAEMKQKIAILAWLAENNPSFALNLLS